MALARDGGRFMSFVKSFSHHFRSHRHDVTGKLPVSLLSKNGFKMKYSILEKKSP